MPEIDIIRAHPFDTRKTMDAVREFVRCGVRFVPIPVLNNTDGLALVEDMGRRLTLLDEEWKRKMGAVNLQ